MNFVNFYYKTLPVSPLFHVRAKPHTGPVERDFGFGARRCLFFFNLIRLRRVDRRRGVPSPFPALCESTNVVDQRVGINRHHIRRRSILIISSKYIIIPQLSILRFILRFISTIKIIHIITIIIITIIIRQSHYYRYFSTKEVEYVGIHIQIHNQSNIHIHTRARRRINSKPKKNRDERKLRRHRKPHRNYLLDPISVRPSIFVTRSLEREILRFFRQTRYGSTQDEGILCYILHSM